MCGIVGIIGVEPVAPRLVEALKRLEYRGYDSAGIATLEHGAIARRRAEGKLGNLASKLEHEPLGGTIGIGHTRWATHGAPNESNAHPHATDRVAIVHNGIIENFRELLDELASRRLSAQDADRHRSRRPSGDARARSRPATRRRRSAATLQATARAPLRSPSCSRATTSC